MTPQAILADLLECGLVPTLTPDGRGIALPAGQVNPAQRVAIVAHKAALVAHLAAAAPPAPAPATWCSVVQPWRVADQLYQNHHWQCTTCSAAATGHAARCPEGQRLHDAYTTQVMAV